MNASIVIATANRSADLGDTLRSLARIQQPGTVELIVADNGSTDGARLIVEHAARAKAAREAGALTWHTLRAHVAAAFEHELWLCFFDGLARQRWTDRSLPVADGPATVRTFTERTPDATLDSERVDLVT
jgi:GT2 family glycosyltransferase